VLPAAAAKEAIANATPTVEIVNLCMVLSLGVRCNRSTGPALLHNGVFDTPKTEPEQSRQ
jgi:hypothetical protein